MGNLKSLLLKEYSEIFRMPLLRNSRTWITIGGFEKDMIKGIM